MSVVASASLDLLTDDVADVMSRVPSDPFSSDIVVVPNVGVRDWLQRELSQRLGAGRAGIVANVRFLFAQQFLDLVLGADSVDRVDTWDIEHLMWQVHRAIDGLGRASIPGASTRPLTVARAIADLFDRYSVHRPSMLRYWRVGRAVDAIEPLRDLPDHLRWQPDLYGEVCRRIAADSPADRLARLDQLIDEFGLSELIPERVVLFGFVTMNATMRRVVEVLANHREVHLHLLHPTTIDPSERQADQRRLTLRDHGIESEKGNPLLARWARPSMETRQLIPGSWRFLDNGNDRTQPTCLETLRRSIIDDRAVETSAAVPSPTILDHGDGSIQVHACHGQVRQVEVLRDALLHLLCDDPTLTLDDISIQCPDLVSFAPIIPAVFRSGQSAVPGASPPLDVTVSDRVLAGDNPYEDAFWSLLALARSRCSVSEVLTMLSAAPVRRRFGIDDETFARATEWFDELAVRFGLDVGHRSKWNVPESISRGTWDDALDRLFMGLAVPAETPFQGPGGIVPFDDVAVTDAPALARIAEFVSQVSRLAHELDDSRSIADWTRILRSVVEDFFDRSETQEFSCSNLLEAIGRLDEAARRADSALEETFGFEEVTAILQDLASSRSSRPRLRTGAITVTELLPQQGVPYRVIALLGVNDAMFAGGGTRGDDILSLSPCVGEPMPMAAGRLQLLNVVLAARDALVITCNGANINNNNEIPLPVPVQEILEVTGVLLSRDEDSRRGSIKVLTKHPRQSYAPQSLKRGGLRADRPFSFDPVALDVHALQAAHPSPIMAGRRSNRDVSLPARVTIEDMRRAITKPADHFLGTVLGTTLPERDVGSGNDFIDLWPTSLESYRVGDELLDEILRSGSDPHDVVTRLAWESSLSGRFPPGRLGEVEALRIADEVVSVLNGLPDDKRRPHEHRAIEVSDVLRPGSTSETVTGSVDDVLDHELIRVSFARFKESRLLGPWVDLALVTLSDPEEPWKVRLVARGESGKGVMRLFSLVGRGPSQRKATAERVVTTVLDLMTCQLRGRVPYLPETSWTMTRKSLEAARSVFETERKESNAVRFLFNRVPWDDYLAEPVQEGDPTGTTDTRAERFAELIWGTFTGTVDWSSPAEDHE